MKVDYDFLESNYSQVREQVINRIEKDHHLSHDKAIAIVDYENSTILGEVEHNQVKSYMEQDLQFGRPFNIQLMADMLICNDEGRYQLDIK